VLDSRCRKWFGRPYDDELEAEAADEMLLMGLVLLLYNGVFMIAAGDCTVGDATAAAGSGLAGCDCN